MDSQSFKNAWKKCWDQDLVNHRPGYPPAYLPQEQISPSPKLKGNPTLLSGQIEPTRKSGHRSLRIPELLEMVLLYAGPEMQIVALEVCTTWRASAVSAITHPVNLMEFRHPREREPIEYGQAIKFELPGPKPTSEEIEEFRGHIIEMFCKRCHTAGVGSKCIYFLARLRQFSRLLNEIRDVCWGIDHRYLIWANLPFPMAPMNVESLWLDLTQVQINPYFQHLFARTGRMLDFLGHWEVALSPSASGLFPGRSLGIKLFLESIGSMHVTYPPCKTLGIHHTDTAVNTGPSFNKLLMRLHNDDDIRISQLLNTMEQCAPTVISTWTQNVKHFLQKTVPVSHWIDDIWDLPARPTIAIYMDNHEMPVEEIDPEAIYTEAERDAVVARMGYSAHITRVAYMSARPFRESREGAWIPKEIFELMKSETGRSPINWNT